MRLAYASTMMSDASEFRNAITAPLTKYAVGSPLKLL